MTARGVLRWCWIAAAVSLVVAGCGREAGVAADDPRPAAEAERLAEAEPPGEADHPAEASVSEVPVGLVDEAQPAAIEEGIVTFVVGDAFMRDAPADWIPLDIGDPVPARSTVRVAQESYVDIQLGSLAAVRVEAGTTVTIDHLSLGSTDRRATVDVAVGSVLSRVDRLTGNDRYRVRSATTVAGVRGTDFGVTVTDEMRTLVGVQTGSVSVTPRWIDDLQTMTDGADDVDLVEAVTAVVRSLEREYVAASGEQAIVDEVVHDAVQDRVGLVAAAARTLVAAPPAEQESALKELRRLSETVYETGQEAVRIDPLTPAVRERIRRVDDLQILPAPPVSAPDATVSQREALEEMHAHVRVSVTPDDAALYAGDVSIGRSRFAGVYPVGMALLVEAYADGYEPYFEEIVLSDPGVRVVSIAMEALPDAEEPEQPGPAVSSVAEEDPDDPELPDAPEPAPVEPTPPPEYTVLVQAEPPNAVISINGQQVGRGRYSGRYEPGTRLAVNVSLSDYDSQTQTVTVPERDVDLAFTLVRAQRTITIEVSPPEAEVRLAGMTVGVGRHAGAYQIGEQLEFEVAAPGYVTRSLDLHVDANIPTRHLVTLERERRVVRVSVEPTDAAIFLGSRQVGTGEYEELAAVDRTLHFRAERDGYAPAELTVSVAATDGSTHSITLEPRPIERRIPVGDAPFVRAMVAASDLLVTADRDGTVRAVDVEGAVRWTVTTANYPNENSPPVIAFDRVYLTGAAEFVVIDLQTGAVLHREPLESDASHLFGRRVVVSDERLYYPSNREIRVLDPAGAQVSAVTVPDGSSMTPALVGDRLVVADQSGTVRAFDAASLVEVASVPTDLTQPVSLAPAVADGIAYIAGRRGTVVAVEVARAVVVWQTELESGRSTGSYVDPVVDAHTLFVFARDAIYALRRSDGRRAYDPLTGATSPPLLMPDALLYGDQEGNLVIADPATGSRIASLKLGARVSARPAVWNDRYVVGLESGEILVINPQGIERQ